jgi:hypothetical protein
MQRVFLALYALGSRSNIDDSETFKALQNLRCYDTL